MSKKPRDKKLPEVLFTVQAYPSKGDVACSENKQRTLEGAMKIAKLMKTLRPSFRVKVKKTTVEIVEEL